MNSKQRILAALQRETPDRVPTFEWFIDASVGQALTGSDDPVDTVADLDIDGINIRPDYTKDWIDQDTYRDEWGSVRKPAGDCIAPTLDNPLSSISDYKDYSFPEIEAPHRFATLQRALERFGDERAVILNLRDGFSDMRDILGYENALMGTITDPDDFKALLNRCVDYNLALAEYAVKHYGVEMVATTDDIANAQGLLIRPETYFDLIGPAFIRVIRGYRDLGLLVIKHCDGDCSAVLDLWIEAGIHCLDPIDPGAGLDMADMKSRYGDYICLKGNIDCAGVLEHGTPDEVEEEVKTCLQKGAANGGLILSSSNTIHRGVPPENYRAMLQALHTHGRYQKNGCVSIS